MNEVCMSHTTMPVWLWILLAILFLWETVWKLIALWKSARNNHFAWFICIVIFNTAGILPILYIVTHRKKDNEPLAA